MRVCASTEMSLPGDSLFRQREKLIVRGRAHFGKLEFQGNNAHTHTWFDSMDAEGSCSGVGSSQPLSAMLHSTPHLRWFLSLQTTVQHISTQNGWRHRLEFTVGEE